jgi:serine/threonine protein kinase
MLNRLHGQPESYDKKAKYRFGRTLGAGTYGVVREADGPTGKVAVKIILKKSVKGNEKMVYDELDMLQRLKHPHIVQFVDWFESRVSCRKLKETRPQTTGTDEPLCNLGQVLHCDPARDRWRAFRPNL